MKLSNHRRAAVISGVTDLPRGRPEDSKRFAGDKKPVIWDKDPTRVSRPDLCLRRQVHGAFSADVLPIQERSVLAPRVFDFPYSTMTGHPTVLPAHARVWVEVDLRCGGGFAWISAADSEVVPVGEYKDPQGVAARLRSCDYPRHSFIRSGLFPFERTACRKKTTISMQTWLIPTDWVDASGEMRASGGRLPVQLKLSFRHAAEFGKEVILAFNSLKFRGKRFFRLPFRQEKHKVGHRFALPGPVTHCCSSSAAIHHDLRLPTSVSADLRSRSLGQSRVNPPGLGKFSGGSLALSARKQLSPLPDVTVRFRVRGSHAHNCRFQAKGVATRQNTRANPRYALSFVD